MGFSAKLLSFASPFCRSILFVSRENMGQKAFLVLRLLVLFLGFSFLIASAAVPTARILKSTFDQPSAQDFVYQDARDLEVNGGDSFERLIEGRQVLESNDYPGTGANNHHDPNSPAKP